MHSLVRFFLIALIALIFLGDHSRLSSDTILVAADQSPTLSFGREVLPILSAKCFSCHGPDRENAPSSLRLDIDLPPAAESTSAIIPGDSAGSELYQRVISEVAELRMPPATSGHRLSDAEIGVIKRWIDEGAIRDTHWAYRPLTVPPVPVVSDSSHSLDPIDSFILAELEKHELTLSPEADPATLLRRLSLDLTGLPPDPDEVIACVSADSAEYLEHTVDRLLASPHFGERWGRHWLDAARFADSTGFETDAPKSMWKYRDWVIQAISDDLPFDEFVRIQLAGDLIPNATLSSRTATGFLLCGPQDGGSEPARLDAVVDRTNTIGSVFLGLTLGCAQCHSHKFDAVSQQEYYELFAFVNSADEQIVEFADAEALTMRDSLRKQITLLTDERQRDVEARGIRDVSSDDMYQQKTAAIRVLESQLPQFDTTSVLMTAVPVRSTTLFYRGEYSQPGPAVTPGVPAVLHSINSPQPTRLDLAEWLVSAQNPLTSRVTVNRIWQQLFGRGLVETENDFGTQGTPPSHPELLDWLAASLIEDEWRIKPLIRRIVMSSAYRQSSQTLAMHSERDPENRLISRQSRRRLDAEIIRDAALKASGLLATEIGGPSVFPFQHDGLMENRATPAPWIMSTGTGRHRRTLYTHYWRLTPHPFLQTFDAPDSLTSCTRRHPTNNPVQSLTMLNDPIFIECAEALGRQLADNPDGTTDKLRYAFLRCLGRYPDTTEVAILQQVHSETAHRSGTAISRSVPGETAAWTQVVRTLFNTDEFITRE
jgi:hypothetical protein